MCKMAQSYVVENRLLTALRWSAAAVKSAPSCPIANWDHAGSLFLLGRDAAAERRLRIMLKRGIRGITNAGDSCSQSRGWAKAYLADCHFLLSSVLNSRGKLQGALREARNYVRARESGSRSSYMLEEGRSQVTRLEGIVKRKAR